MNARRSIVSQIGSFLSAVYQPNPAAGPNPFSSYIVATELSVPYEMPAVCVSRSRMVICRFAGTMVTPVSLRTATLVEANAGMKRLTGSLMLIFPSSTSDRIATLVIAFVCEAMRKIVFGVIFRPASLSLHPRARS